MISVQQKETPMPNLSTKPSQNKTLLHFSFDKERLNNRLPAKQCLMSLYRKLEIKKAVKKHFILRQIGLRDFQNENK